MKRCKHIIHLLIVCMLTLSICPTITYARPIRYEDQDITLARVLEVISGEAIKVMEFDNAGNGQVKLVRMVGIETDSSQEAYDYVYDRLLGRRIMLLPDDQGNNFKPLNGWIYRHVYISPKESISQVLLAQGLARINHNFDISEQYTDLVKAEKTAQNAKKGLWKNLNVKLSIGVNINRATITDLLDTLEDTNSSMAYAIINYRKYNPFNNIEEIKFVGPAFSKKWYDKNRYKLSVITNLKEASYEEMRSLFSDFQLGEIIGKVLQQYRLFNTLDSLMEIKKISTVEPYYKEIEPFIALQNVSEYKVDVKKVNLNTASINQIAKVSMFSTSRSEKIIKERQNQTFILKSLGQLEKSKIVNNHEVRLYSDNFTFFTDINTAGTNELESLFGFMDFDKDKIDALVKKIVDLRPYTNIYECSNAISFEYYQKIKKYIYVNEVENSYINLNLMERSIAANMLGMDVADRDEYVNSRSHYDTSDELKIKFVNYADKITLFTNINNASRYEIEHIYGRVWKNSKYKYTNLPDKIVDDIITFREDQPFCKIEELKIIFEKHKEIAIYNSIKEYIVFY